MRALAIAQADTYLRGVGMKIGDWNQLVDIDVGRHKGRKWIHQRLPEDARRVYTFAQHVAGWLPPGDWKLLQIDNSNSLDPVQLALVSSLLVGPGREINLFLQRSFIFEFSGDAESD
jgi:hypothetical protein